MVQALYLVAVVAAIASVADAHTAMTIPKPTYPQGFYQYMNPVMRINGNNFARDIPSYQGVEKVTAAIRGQASLKSFIMSNAALTGTGSATKECGWALANGERQPLPSAVVFPWGHPGPCEVWCDNTKVFYNDNCMGNGVGSVSLGGKCNGARMIQAMYIGTHVEKWEVYMSCAPVGAGGGGGAAAGEPTTTAATTATTTTTLTGPMTSTRSTTVTATAATTTNVAGTARSESCLDIRGSTGARHTDRMGFVGWPLGLFLSAISSIFGILGKLFLKLAHNEKEREEDEELQRKVEGKTDTTPPTTSKAWYMYFYAGLLSMLVLNPALGATAYSFASQSLLAPMAGLTIGWNTLMGPLLLPNERLTTHDFIGALLIFVGCVLVGVSGSHETPPLPVDELSSRFVTVPFLLYSIALGVIVFFLLHQSRQPLIIAGQSHRSSSVPKDVMRLDKATLTRIEKVSISVLAGIASGQLFFLAAAMRLAKNGRDEHVWSHPVMYICIVGALSTALLGLYLLNAALKVDDAVVVIYLYEASYIMSGAISGLCFFQDMNQLSAWHFVVYSLSLVLILVGIYVVASRNNGAPTSEEEENLLPLLAAPPTVGDVASDQLFRKASYYAASHRSSSYQRLDDEDRYRHEYNKRRKSYPFASATKP